MQCTLRTNPGRQQIVNQAPTQTATSSKNAWPRRLHALDASRGLAALTVVIWHWQHFFYTNTAPAVDFRRDSQPLYSALKLFYEQGKWGGSNIFLFFPASSFSGFITMPSKSGQYEQRNFLFIAFQDYIHFMRSPFS